MTLLEVRGLDAGYGDFQALFGIDVDVAEGETLAMIGANGAGKTTFLRVLAGQVPAWAGSIMFDGTDIAHVKAHRRVGLGIALVPEGRMLFGSLTVRENLIIGAHAGRSGRWDLDTVLDVFPLIRPLLDRPSHVLSGGEQQSVAIGRALMSNPRLILLDEVSLGLAPVVVKSLYAGPARPVGGGCHRAAGGAGHRAGPGSGLPAGVPAGGAGVARGQAGGGFSLRHHRGLLRTACRQRLRGIKLMEWLNAIVQGIMLGGLFALFATGLSLAFGVMRFVNLAHGDLAILGAFVAVSVISATGLNPFVSLVIVVPVMLAAGYALQLGAFNFTISPDPLPSILVTFGLGIVIQNVLLETYSADSRGLDVGSIEIESIRVTDAIAIGWIPLITLIVAVTVLGALQLMLSRTSLGRAFRAVSDDPPTARLMGINDRNLYAVAMGIAFATVAIAGVFLGIRQSFGPLDGPAQLLYAFEAVVIGGLGSVWGTLVGGLILGVAHTVGGQFEVSYGYGSGPLVGHLVFLVVLATKPSGLLGRRTE